MQRLKPLKVPWQVVPSTPNLKLVASESDEPFEVFFVAMYGPLAQHAYGAEMKGALEAGFESVTIAPNPFKDFKGTASTDYVVIRLVFDGGRYARIVPSSVSEVLPYGTFDTSLLPQFPGPYTDEAVRSWFKDKQESWVLTGLCPDPSAYEVESSELVEEVGYTSPLRHFIIEGHDAYIEVLAKDWMWEVFKKLPEGW